MSPNNDDFDPWSLETLTETPTADSPKLVIETIEGVEPLDDQFGAHPPKTVPDGLYGPLFGEPKPSEADLEAAGGDPKRVPPMLTYAILDEAKLPNLRVALETSGLEHRCLFKGDAYDELKDVAPYIVRLEEGNDFTRHLFTRGKAVWFLWDKEPGIHVRSRGSLDDMWRHFRKFTKLKDENDKWFYFRFWEPFTLPILANMLVSQDNHLLKEILYTSTSVPLTILSFWNLSFFCISPNINVVREANKRNTELRITGHEKKIFENVAAFKFDQKLKSYLAQKDKKFGAFAPDKQQHILQDILKSAETFDISTEKAIADFAEANILYRRPVERHPDLLRILSSEYHDLDRTQNLLAIVKKMVNRNGY